MWFLHNIGPMFRFHPSIHPSSANWMFSDAFMIPLGVFLSSEEQWKSNFEKIWILVPFFSRKILSLVWRKTLHHILKKDPPPPHPTHTLTPFCVRSLKIFHIVEVKQVVKWSLMSSTQACAQKTWSSSKMPADGERLIVALSWDWYSSTQPAVCQITGKLDLYTVEHDVQILTCMRDLFLAVFSCVFINSCVDKARIKSKAVCLLNHPRWIIHKQLCQTCLDSVMSEPSQHIVEWKCVLS